MPNRVRILTVPDSDRAELERRARSKGAPARVVERARIVLLAADGLTGRQIAGRAGCTEPTVAPPPESLRASGVTHWSSRRLAGWLLRARGVSVSHDSISVLWRKFCLQPHRTEGFKFSTDPQLEAKVRDVVGLYLEPPENAVVVCVDEKTQIQALDRTRPVLPMRPGIPERQTHDYIRHGTTTLFAALEAATGTVTDACYPRHRHGEFLKFLKKVAAAYPGQDLHVVCDNYATHKHAEVRKWLARPGNQRITLHFVPTSCSWLNLVECFFSVITRQAIRRATFTSVKELTTAIGVFIDHWNDHPRPFTWTEDADEIPASIQRAPPEGSTVICADELGPVIPRT